MAVHVPQMRHPRGIIIIEPDHRVFGKKGDVCMNAVLHGFRGEDVVEREDPVRFLTTGDLDHATKEAMKMSSLLMLAVVLVGAWVVITLVFQVVGLLVHLLLLIGAVLFLVWAWKKLTGRDNRIDTTT